MDTSTEETVSLQKVLDGDESTILHLRQLLSIRGWCFVDVPLSIPKISKTTLERAEEFFKLSDEEKVAFKLPTNFGYVPHKSKQGYRALTGPLLAELDLPEQLKDCVSALSFKLDQMCRQIIDKISVPFFGFKLNPSNNTLTLLANAKYSGYGMLDIVEYYNNDNNDLIDKKIVVDSHGDPGLFSISLGSTSPGLSMHDPQTKKWVPVPTDKCVLWLGSAARELLNYSHQDPPCTLKVGMHRVELSEKGPRRTLWYEVCTKYQVPKAIQFYGLKAVPPPVDPQTDSIVRVNMKTLMGQVVPLELRGNDVVYKMKELMQDKKGFPPEKQRLFFKPKGVLLDEMTLNECGIKDGDDVHQILSLRS